MKWMGRGRGRGRAVHSERAEIGILNENGLEGAWE